MRYAICNETFEAWPLERACDFVRSLGYEGLEIAPFTLAGHLQELSATQRRDIRQTIESSGLEVVGLHWLLAKTEGLHVTSPDSEVRKATTAYMVQLVELCGDLGGHVMVFGSPQQRAPTTHQTLVSCRVSLLETGLHQFRMTRVPNCHPGTGLDLVHRSLGLLDAGH